MRCATVRAQIVPPYTRHVRTARTTPAGGEVALAGDGTSAFVSAPATVSSTLLGVVYVFVRDATGVWAQSQRLTQSSG